MMIFVIRITLEILTYFLPGCGYFKVNECEDIKWKEFYVIGSEETKGSVMLSVMTEGQVFNKLNTLILNTSEYLSEVNFSGKVLSERVIRLCFSDVEVEADKPELFYDLKTSVPFCFKELLCYKVRAEVVRSPDKGSPYYEYLNINSRRNSIITISDVIGFEKQTQFMVFLLSYAKANKKGVVENYQNVMSERIGDIYAPLDEFASTDYSLKNVRIRNTDTISMISLQKAGIEFSVEVTDENFKEFKESFGHVYTYQSSIVIPYQLLKPFLNKKSTIFNSLKQLSDNE